MRLHVDQVMEIFLSDDSTSVLVNRFGVSSSTIRSIKRRRSHPDSTGQMQLLPGRSKGNRHILDDLTVLEIFAFSGTVAELKAKYGVSKKVADNIKFRYTYRSITEDLGQAGELKVHTLTWDDVCTIRASIMETYLLAIMFGISTSTVNNIRSGRTRQFK